MARIQRNSLRPSLDPLEGRRLLATGVTASLSHGVLTVTGTEAPNVLILTVQGPSRANHGGAIHVYGLPQSFPVARVKAIDIVGGPGNDAIAVLKSGRVTTPITINGGGGNDLINGAWSNPTATIAPTATPIAVTPAPSTTTSMRMTMTTTSNSATSPYPTGETTATLFPTGTTTPKSTPVSPPTATSLSQIGRQIIALTNAQRAQAGLPPLAESGRLDAAARIESNQMVRTGQVSHDLPGTADPEPQDRAAAVGYRYQTLGENIAFNYPDASSVVAAWMASPGHRANILNTTYTQIGVAVAYDSAGQAYYTQEFGEPA